MSKEMYPVCPMCHVEDEEVLLNNTESVYECAECGELYMAINKDGVYEYDAYSGE